MRLCPKYLKLFMDAAVTLILWTYFTLGFVLFFAPVYIGASAFAPDRRLAFQRLNHRFFKGFFRLLQAVTPGLSLEIDGRVTGLKSCVAVSNHRSYLDPLLLIASFEFQSTIVKKDFFLVPILGRVIKAAGYIPSEGKGRLAPLLMRRIEWMHDYLAQGGVLFIFPEGTRSRTGRLGQFNKGAFKIARSCDTSIEVLAITNTDRLFKPGRFLFNTCVKNHINVRWIGRIPREKVSRLPIEQVMAEVLEIMGKTMDQDSGRNPEPADCL